MADAAMSPFLKEVLSRPGGETVLQCYQCGTCSGSCPVIEEMDYGPRRIMRMIHDGEEELVLSSHDMWFCVSCYSCANRCPRDIPITDVMALLRSMAIEKGYQDDKEAQFGQAFAATVRQHGRMFEPELLIRYYLRVLDVLSLLQMVPLGLKMMLRGKIPILPERVRSPQALQRICVADMDAKDEATGEEAADKLEFELTPHQKRALPWIFSGVMMFLGFAVGGLFFLFNGRKKKE
jgi:heterodisulfide reductase subunit C